MGAKIKTEKNPWGFKQNPQKSLDQNLAPQKSNDDFPSHKNFQKASIDTVKFRKKANLVPRAFPSKNGDEVEKKPLHV